MSAARSLARGALVLVPAFLASCRDEAPPAPPVRPVLSVLVEPRAARAFGFTGTIEPRYRVSLGFRILGRLVAREVEVGDRVKAGGRLAAIDPVALDLAVRSAQAEAFTAQAQLANAAGVEDRQRTLLAQNTATTAQFEAAQQAREAAAAALRRAEANLVKAREQLGYADLRSDIDGVVTAIGAQVGQVVSPGQAVVTVARPDVREASLDVPDELLRDLKPGAVFDISLQLDPSVRTTGRLREIAPQADPTTRTRRLLVTLDPAPAAFRLGTTVTVVLTAPAAAAITLPASALLSGEGGDRVWIVDPATRTVAPRPVTLAARDAGTIRVAAGLSAGERVVTAGVHSLSAGQAVTIPDDSAP